MACFRFRYSTCSSNLEFLVRGPIRKFQLASLPHRLARLLDRRRRPRQTEREVIGRDYASVVRSRDATGRMFQQQLRMLFYPHHSSVSALHPRITSPPAVHLPMCPTSVRTPPAPTLPPWASMPAPWQQSFLEPFLTKVNLVGGLHKISQCGKIEGKHNN